MSNYNIDLSVKLAKDSPVDIQKQLDSMKNIKLNINEIKLNDQAILNIQNSLKSKNINLDLQLLNQDKIKSQVETISKNVSETFKKSMNLSIDTNAITQLESRLKFKNIDSSVIEKTTERLNSLNIQINKIKETTSGGLLTGLNISGMDELGRSVTIVDSFNKKTGEFLKSSETITTSFNNIENSTSKTNQKLLDSSIIMKNLLNTSGKLNILNIDYGNISRFEKEIIKIKNDISDAMKTSDIQKQNEAWVNINNSVKLLNNDINIYKKSYSSLNSLQKIDFQKENTKSNIDTYLAKNIGLSTELKDKFSELRKMIYSINNSKSLANVKTQLSTLKNEASLYTNEQKKLNEESQKLKLNTEKTNVKNDIDKYLKDNIKLSEDLKNKFLEFKSSLSSIDNIKSLDNLKNKISSLKGTVDKKNISDSEILNNALKEQAELLTKINSLKSVNSSLFNKNESSYDSNIVGLYDNVLLKIKEINNASTTNIATKSYKEFEKAIIGVGGALTEDELKQKKLTEEAQKFRLELQKTNIKSNIDTFLSTNSKLTGDLKNRFIDLKKYIDSVDDSKSLANVKTQLSTLKNEAKSTGMIGKNVVDEITNDLKKLTYWVSATSVLFEGIRQVKQGVQFITELDNALSTINMTMPVTASQLEDVGNKSIQMALDLKTSASNVLKAVAIYANANETADSILQKAQPTIMLSNASGMDASTTSDIIQGTLNQFDLAEDQAMYISDVYQKISENIAVDFQRGIQEISSAIQVSGSVAKSAGLSLEEYGSIIAKVVEKTRLSGSQIGTATRTLFTRITKSGSGEATAEDISKAETAFRSVGVEIRSDNETFREMGDILSDLAEKWDTLSDVQKSNIAYEAAGTRQVSIFSSLISSYDEIEELTQKANEASGTTLKNQEIYEKTITARTKEFTTQLNAFWNNVIDDDVIKSFISSGTEIVKVIDNIISSIGVLNTSLIALGTFGLMKNIGFFKSFIIGLREVQVAVDSIRGMELIIDGSSALLTAQSLNAVTASVQGLSKEQAILALSTTNLTEKQTEQVLLNAGIIATNEQISASLISQALSITNLSASEKEDILTKLGLIDANTGLILSTNTCTEAELLNVLATKGIVGENAELIVSQIGLTASNASTSVSFDLLTVSIWANIKAIGVWLASNPVGWAILAIGAVAGVVKVIDELTISYDEHVEKLKKLKQEYEDITSSVGDLESKLSDVASKIDEINSKDKLSITDENDLINLEAQSKELEKQLLIQKEQQRIAGEKAEKEAIETLNATFTSSYRTERREGTSLGNGRKTYYQEYSNVTNIEELDAIIGSYKAYELILNQARQAQEKLTQTEGYSIDEFNKKQDIIDEYSKKMEKARQDANDIVLDIQEQSESILGYTESGTNMEQQIDEVMDSYVSWTTEIDSLTKSFDELEVAQKRSFLANKLNKKGVDYDNSKNFIESLDEQDLSIVASLEIKEATDIDELITKFNDAKNISIETTEIMFSSLSDYIYENKDAINEYKQEISELSDYLSKVVSGDITKADKNKLALDYGIIANNDAEYYRLISDSINKSGANILTPLEKSINNTKNVAEKINMQKFLDQLKDIKIEAVSISKSVEEWKNIFDSSISSITDLKSMITEIDANGKLDDSSIEKIVSDYPELIMFLDDETTLRQKLSEIIKKQESISRNAYFRMMQDNKDYFANLKEKYSEQIDDVSNSINEIINNNKDLVDVLGDYYDVDLKNFKSLSESKKKLETDLITNLENAWIKYQKVVIQGQYAVVRSQYSALSYAGGAEMAKQYNENSKAISDAKNAAQDSADAYNKAIEELNKLINTDIIKTTDEIDKSGSIKSFEKELDFIERLLTLSERKIEKYNNALNNAFTVKSKKSALTSLIREQENQVELLIKIRKFYNQEASDILLKIPKAYRSIVKDGSIDIKTITDEKLAETIEKYWDLSNASNDATDKIRELNETISDNKLLKIKVDWDSFDKTIDQIDRVIDQIDFLSDQISDEESLNITNGEILFSNDGLAKLKLLSEGIKKASSESKKLSKEIAKLQKSYKEGTVYEEEYRDRLDDLTSQLYDANNTVQDYRDSIVDLMQVKKDAEIEQLEELAEAFEKVTNARKEELQAQLDAYNKKREMDDSEDEITKVQKRLSELQRAVNKDDRSAIAEYKQLQDKLAELQQESKDKQFENEINAQIKAQDDALDNYNENLEKQKSALEDYYENQNQLIIDAANLTKDSFISAYNSIMKIAKQNNLSIIKELQSDLNNYLSSGIVSSSKTSSTTATTSTGTTKDNISAILGTKSTENVKLASTAGSQLNKYVMSKGYDKLSYTEMVALAQQLGITTTVDEIKSSGTTKILNALKNASFSTGGYVDASHVTGNSDLLSKTGEGGLGLVRHGEYILTQKEAPLFEDFVNNLNPLNQLVSSALSIDKNKIIDKPMQQVLNFEMPLTIQGNADSNTITEIKNLMPDIANYVKKEINRDYTKRN